MSLRLSLIISLTAALSFLAGVLSLAGEEPAASPIQELDNERVWILAQERAPLVEAARAAVQEARSQRNAQLSGFYPQLQASMNWQRQGSAPQQRDIPVIPSATPPPFQQQLSLPGAPRHAYQGQLRLEQSLLTAGRYSSVRRISAAAISAAEEGLLSSERDAGLRALIALDAYRFAVAAHDISLARLEQRQGELADAEKLFEVGSVPMLDVRQTRINQTLAQDLVQETTAGMQGALAELAAALALDPEYIAVHGELSRPQGLATAITEARAHIADSSDLRQLGIAYDIARLQQRQEMLSHLPSLGGVIGYQVQGSRLNALSDDWFLGLGANWTLVDGGGRYARRSALQAQARRLQAQYDATLNERSRELAVIEAESQAIAARISLQESVIDDISRNYEDARVLYQSGEITLTRVGEVGLGVVEAQFNLSRYRFEESVLAHRLRAFRQ